MTAMELRQERARGLLDAGDYYVYDTTHVGVKTQGGKCPHHGAWLRNGLCPICGWNGEYLVVVVPDSDPRGLVRQTYCDCPDWERLDDALHERPGVKGRTDVPQIDGHAACKHVLAAAHILGLLA